MKILKLYKIKFLAARQKNFDICTFQQLIFNVIFCGGFQIFNNFHPQIQFEGEDFTTPFVPT